MTHRFRRLFAYLLAAAMVLAYTPTVFADDQAAADVAEVTAASEEVAEAPEEALPEEAGVVTAEEEQSTPLEAAYAEVTGAKITLHDNREVKAFANDSSAETTINFPEVGDKITLNYAEGAVIEFVAKRVDGWVWFVSDEMDIPIYISLEFPGEYNTLEPGANTAIVNIWSDDFDNVTATMPVTGIETNISKIEPVIGAGLAREVYLESGLGIHSFTEDPRFGIKVTYNDGKGTAIYHYDEEASDGGLWSFSNEKDSKDIIHPYITYYTEKYGDREFDDLPAGAELECKVELNGYTGGEFTLTVKGNPVESIEYKPVRDIVLYKDDIRVLDDDYEYYDIYKNGGIFAEGDQLIVKYYDSSRGTVTYTYKKSSIAFVDSNGSKLLGQPFVDDYDWIYDGETGTQEITVHYFGKEVEVQATLKEGSNTVKDISTAEVTVNDVTYTGKTPALNPVVVLNGDTLVKGTDYTIKVTGVNVGSAKYVITGAGSYTGTISGTFKINPRGATLSSVKAAKKAATVKWKKQTAKMSKTRITGYQIKYSTDKTFKTGAKNVSVKGYNKASKKITKLQSKKTYYVRLRTYTKVGKTTYYSQWSKVKSVKVK